MSLAIWCACHMQNAAAYLIFNYHVLRGEVHILDFLAGVNLNISAVIVIEF